MLFAIISGYVQYTFHKKEVALLKISQPFQDQCQTESGCVIAPKGWHKEQGFYSKKFMHYKATKNSFTIHNHIATDTWLLSKGGKNIELTVENIGEYK